MTSTYVSFVPAEVSSPSEGTSICCVVQLSIKQRWQFSVFFLLGSPTHMFTALPPFLQPAPCTFSLPSNFLLNLLSQTFISVGRHIQYLSIYTLLWPLPSSFHLRFRNNSCKSSSSCFLPFHSHSENSFLTFTFTIKLHFSFLWYLSSLLPHIFL